MKRARTKSLKCLARSHFWAQENSITHHQLNLLHFKLLHSFIISICWCTQNEIALTFERLCAYMSLILSKMRCGILMSQCSKQFFHTVHIPGGSNGQSFLLADVKQICIITGCRPQINLLISVNVNAIQIVFSAFYFKIWSLHDAFSIRKSETHSLPKGRTSKP